MKQVLENKELAQKLSLGAFCKVEKHFSLDAMVSQHQAMYEEVLEI